MTPRTLDLLSFSMLLLDPQHESYHLGDGVLAHLGPHTSLIHSGVDDLYTYSFADHANRIVIQGRYGLLYRAVFIPQDLPTVPAFLRYVRQVVNHLGHPLQVRTALKRADKVLELLVIVPTGQLRVVLEEDYGSMVSVWSITKAAR